MRKLAVIILAAWALAVGAPDALGKRTSKDVRAEKQQTEKQVARTKKQMADNDRETRRQLSRLELIKAEMALRADTIRALQARLDSVGAAINVMNDSIARLVEREESLRDSYARTLRSIRSRRQAMSDLSFIFSAGSFTQAWRRMRYLGEVASAGTKQAKQLAAAKTDVEAARESLEALRTDQAAALRRHNAAQAALRTEQASADNLVANLKKQGKSLQRELDRRQRQAQSLDRELDRIIANEQAEERRRQEELRRAEEEARKKAEAEARRKAEEDKKKGGKPAEGKPEPKPVEPPKPAPKPEYAAEAEKSRKLTGSFVSNKGRLLFPVEGKYTIISNFGTNEMPELSRVKVDNLGIDIETPQGAAARAVFEGVVSSIFRLDGYKNIVMVRHGEYLSVYAGIDALAVKKGDKVKTGQRLGTITTVPDRDRARLHFEIRHETKKLNPTDWVGK